MPHHGRGPAAATLSGMPATVLVNGQQRILDASGPHTLEQLVGELKLQPDRVAIERNGVIVPRGRWAETWLANGDRLEMVHFVGGGSRP